MTKYQYLTQLLAENDLAKFFRALKPIAEKMRGDSTYILLAARHNRLRKEVTAGVLSSSEKNLRTNQIIASCKSYLEDVMEELPDDMNEQSDQRLKPNAPDVKENSEKPSSITNVFHISGGNIGGITTGGTSHITQNNDQRSLHQQVGPIQQVAQAQEQEGYITKEEYDELIEILGEIQKGAEPTEEKKPKWKRVLGKVADQAGKFTAKRIEKGIDTGVSEAAKTWIKEGGPQQLLDFVGNF